MRAWTLGACAGLVLVVGCGSGGSPNGPGGGSRASSGGSAGAAPDGSAGVGGSGAGGSGTGGAGTSGTGGSSTGGSSGAGTGGTAGAGTGGSGGSSYCGDGHCDPGEIVSCPADCAPPNDDCPGQEIPLTTSGSTESGTISGSTVGLGDDPYIGCSWGPDAVYSFTTQIGGVANVKLDSTFDAGLMLYPTCGNVNQTQCADSTAGPGVEQLSFPVEAGHTYWLAVDGHTGGTFNLDVEVGSPPTCSAPESVTWKDANGAYTFDVSSTTAGTPSSTSPSCGGGGGDAMFAVTAPASGPMLLELPLNGGSGEVLSVRTTCSDAATEIGCAPTQQQLTIDAQAGTTYYVIVDSDSGQSGPFELTGEMGPPTDGGATCPGTPITVTGSPPDIATFSGPVDTTLAPNDFESQQCSTGGGSPDVIRSIVAPFSGRLSVSASTMAAVVPEVSLTRTCGDASTELACTVGEWTWASTDVKAGDTVYIVSQGSSAAESGVIYDSVTLNPAVHCPGTDVTLSGAPPSATIQGTLAGAAAENSEPQAACNYDDTDGPEAIYHFVAPKSGQMTATTTGGYFPDATLYVRSGSCSGGTLVVCNQGSMTFQVVAGTDYYLFVDSGTYFTPDDFTLQLAYQ